MDNESLKPLNAGEIVKIDLLPQLKKVQSLIFKTCKYFFLGNLVMDNSPFKGFILIGPPGTGKTEVVKQSALKLNDNLKNVDFLLIDGASIASPKWGDAEKKLKKIFDEIGDPNRKTILLFDDIESLMLTRGTDLAKEWHYSMNSILFHELDKLNPNNCMIFATTNRPDLVDDAIKTRLYPIEISSLPLDQLMEVVDEILDSSYIENERDRIKIKEDIKERLNKMESPTIRDARHITVVECIEKRVWSL
jgi:SpoVK/Ycf46/Vps4 family AAA+-type ATPase